MGIMVWGEWAEALEVSHGANRPQDNHIILRG